jgi:sigma-B regulation protein RsbU (phosphoserine phosphatase)
VAARPPERVRAVLDWTGRIGIAFLVLLIAEVVISWAAPSSGWAVIIELALAVATIGLAIRVLRRAAGYAVWRLRNRLLVTYLFIAAVPILLIVSLAVTGAEFLARQIAVYLVTSELDRRIEALESAAQSVIRSRSQDRPAVIQGMIDLFYQERYPGIELVMRDSGRTFRYPPKATITSPPDSWPVGGGILRREDRFYLSSYTKMPQGDILVTAPLTREILASLAPNLGVIDFVEEAGSRARLVGTSGGQLPPPVNRLDGEISWFATIPLTDWSQPGLRRDAVLQVRSRVSAVLGAVFNRRADVSQGWLEIMLIIGIIVFLIVEIISVIIGITMTRTITGAVHRLYEGTQKMIQGDFSYRIEVNGKDQLAELSRSFNSMTENLQRLLIVAKEKERLQSEIEIAREVQSQLYPRSVPKTETLRLTAICQPARMVSGDYYDYESIRGKQIALAVGDVAGKGISAALLMATLQSSLRTQLQGWDWTANGDAPQVSPSRLVSRLNNQLYTYTSPEKYATFCLGVFDEANGSFSYTNAGHLPPLLFRGGEARRLDVNGTVVGAFPFATYEESRIDLQSGDLLVCFTDGITEPENEYGEMFGEERLIDLIAKNSHRSEEQIIELVLESVHEWTASEELQDDMTILMARRI